MVINTEMQNSVKILHRKVWTHGNSITFFSDNLGQNYFEQTSILKKSLFSSLQLSITMLKMLTTYMPAWLGCNIVNGGRWGGGVGWGGGEL